MQERNNKRRKVNRERGNTLRLAYWESVIALRSGSVRVTLVLFSLLLIVAMVLGAARTSQRQKHARVVEQENRLVKEIMHDVLQGTLEVDTAAEDKTSRRTRLEKQLRLTAKSPYMLSHASNLWNVSLYPSPLSALSVGASHAWPDDYTIQGMSFSKTIQRMDRVKSKTNAYGPFDASFVVMVIAPLVIIGLTFDVASQDRESDMQNLIGAQTPSLGILMATRCYVRSSLVVTLMVCVIYGVLIIAAGDQLDFDVLVNLSIWNFVATLYLFIWAAISLFVNSFGHSSSSNGIALLLIWLVLVLAIPRFVSNAVDDAIPTLPESELIEHEENAIKQASQSIGRTIEEFQSDYPDVEIRADDEQQMALVRYLLAHDVTGKAANSIVTEHYMAQKRRTKYLGFGDWISPAISFRNQSDRCSGNSEQAFVDFSVHAAGVQAKVARVFLLPSLTNQGCTTETIAELPNFQETEIAKRPQLRGSIETIVAMLCWLIVLVCLATRRFRVQGLRIKVAGNEVA